jgi:hypothetical protein
MIYERNEMEKKKIEHTKHTSEPQMNGKKIGGPWKTGKASF